MKIHPTGALVSLAALTLLFAAPLHADMNILIHYKLDEENNCVIKDKVRIGGNMPKDAAKYPKAKKLHQAITWTLKKQGPGTDSGTWLIDRQSEEPAYLCGNQGDTLSFTNKVATCRTAADPMPTYVYHLVWNPPQESPCPKVTIDPAIIFDEDDKLLPFLPLDTGSVLFPILTLVFASTTLLFWYRARGARRVP